MSFTIGEDLLDTRELIDHLEELKDDFIDSYNTHLEELNEDLDEDDEELYEEIEDFDDVEPTLLDDVLQDEYDEIQDLQDFHDELDGYGDFQYGAALIRREYFADYCKEMLIDCGDLPRELPSYISSNIDWEGVADDLEADYMSASIGNEEYLMRV